MAGDISLPIDLTLPDPFLLPCGFLFRLVCGRQRGPLLPLKQLNQQRLATACVGVFCLNGFMKNESSVHHGDQTYTECNDQEKQSDNAWRVSSPDIIISRLKTSLPSSLWLIPGPPLSFYALIEVQARQENCYHVCNCCSIGWCAATAYLHVLNICQRAITKPYQDSFVFCVPLKTRN